MNIYNARVVAFKEIDCKGKTKKLFWFALYDHNGEFADIVKIWQNKNIINYNVGDEFVCQKGFNKETRETFIFNIIND